MTLDEQQARVRLESIPPHVHRFITLYSANNKTQAEWAKEFDVTDQTISNWVNEYKDEIHTLLNEYRDAVRDDLVKLGKRAILETEVLLSDESSSIRLGAVKTVFENILPKRTENATEITGKSVSISIEEAK